MKMKSSLIFFTLIIVSNARLPRQVHRRRLNGRGSIIFRHHSMWRRNSHCSECYKQNDPCSDCRNTNILITDIWARQCGPHGIGAECKCLCADVLCSENEIIDISTCKLYGHIQDCRCISTSTTTSTTAPPTTKDRYAGCEGCMDDELSLDDTWAGYCFPDTSGKQCFCLCGDLFCRNGQIIDRTTCVNGGDLRDCRCIDTASTSRPIDDF